jgi:hypothetical protein
VGNGRSTGIAPRHSQLFLVRMWLEDLGNGETDLRGSVQHVGSGEVRNFHDWRVMEAFVEGLLKECDNSQACRPRSGRRSSQAPEEP